MPGAAYSVIFPGVPDCAVQNFETPVGSLDRHICQYYDKDVGGGYSTEYFSLPSKPQTDDPRLILKSAAAGAAQESASEITRESEILFDGYPALEVAFLTREERFLAHVLYVQVEEDVLTASVDGGSRMHESPKAAAFLNSLKVSPRSSREGLNKRSN